MADAPVAIITGASSGIGRAAALRLADRGYRLVLAARTADRLEHVAGEARQAGAARVEAVATDVGDPAQMESLIDHAKATFGRIDILINNAGYAPLIPVGQMDRHLIVDSFMINAVGPAVAINRVFPIMLAQRYGRIVNTSTLGTKDPFTGFMVYAGAKTATNLFAQSICREGAEHNVLGFTVAPGAVETPMLRALFDEKKIPREATLDADEVASIIVACACGERDHQAGETIYISR